MSMDNGVRTWVDRALIILVHWKAAISREYEQYKILKKLIDDTFIELENEITHQYKVLTSFKYLEQLILTINIPEEVRNEIPE